MTKKQQLLQVLSDGKSSPIKAHEIEDALKMVKGNTNEPTRQLITDCISEDNWPIGSNNKGYFLIDSPEELKSVIDSLEKRKIGLEKRIKGLRDGWKSREDSRPNGNWPK